MQKAHTVRVVEIVLKYSLSIDQVLKKLATIEPGRAFRPTSKLSESTAEYILANGNQPKFWPKKIVTPTPTPLQIAQIYKLDIALVLHKIRSLLPARRIGKKTRLPRATAAYVKANAEMPGFWPKRKDLKPKKKPIRIVYTPMGGKVG